MIKKFMNLKTIKSNTQKNLTDFVKKCEAKYTTQIDEIARHIAENKNLKFVMIAGPSSAGKTTTSKLLSLALNRLGYNAHVLSLDDFFVEREETPLWEDGSFNYESVNAIDWKLFDECMNNLLKKEETQLPTYNFINGKKEFISKLTMLEHDLIIIEGLHALNKIIDNFIPKKFSVKIYISVFTNVLDNGKILVKSTNVRLLRRMVRDMHSRGTMPEQTVKNWASVNRGEKLYITPFKKSADFYINSFHPYELSVYKSMLNEYSKQKNVDLPTVDILLSKFDNLSKKVVPQFSLLKEFTN
jgi:uridine kinase